MEVVEKIFSWIFLYIADFCTTLLLAELIFCHRFPRRKLFWVRLVCCALPFTLVPYLIDNFYHLKIFYWFGFDVSWLLMFAVSLGILFLCFKISFWRATFYGSAAYAVQHFSSGLKRIVRVEIFGGQTTFVYLIVGFFILLACFLVSYFVFARHMEKNANANIDNKSLVIFSVITVVIVNVFNLWVYQHNFKNDGTDIYAMICCAMLLVVQSGLFTRGKLQQEKNIMAEVVRLAEQQHRQSLVNVELINRKCHDLKYQINAMRNMDGADREKNLQEIERAVTLYDAAACTGNETLDAVLTEKGLLCEQNKISLTSQADGQKLAFMDAVDIYMLFGNALDNAIECESKESEKDRAITLNVFAKGNMLSVNIENFCSVAPKFKNGLPVSTKENNGYHGFGTKSIKYAVEKYGGSINMSHDTDRFRICILIPLH